VNCPVDKMRTGFTDAATAAGVSAPLVTIVIVNYNYGEFVGQCIQSVDQQDYSNIQCIILECASTDNSLSVIERALGRAKNPFFRLLRRDSNRGHVINCLSTLENTRGAFVTYLDADDFLLPEFVSTHVKAHLNDLHSAALSVTDQIQVDGAGQVLAGTCHWHQKWRMVEAGTAWRDLTQARSWISDQPYRMQEIGISRLHYVPAWWSSWLQERWIWGATSGIVFRRSVIESLAPSLEQSLAPLSAISFDGYFARFAHSVGGTVVVDSAQGAYRRHGKNLWSSNQLLGGQTPNSSQDGIGKFQNEQRIARHTLVTKYRDFVRLFGGDLYYSIMWQLMPNEEFLDFANKHEEDKAIWEKTIQNSGTAATPKQASQM